MESFARRTSVLIALPLFTSGSASSNGLRGPQLVDMQNSLRGGLNLNHSTVNMTSLFTTSTNRRLQDGLQDGLNLQVTQETCPECPSGMWSCKAREYCQQPGNHHSRPVPVHVFDFQYYHRFCSEEIPRSSSSVQIDHDIHCLANANNRPDIMLHLQCFNMREFALIQSSAAFEGCVAQGLAEDLVEESCGWICKNSRPVIRCMYNFDRKNLYGFADGILDYCVASTQCTSSDSEELQVVCKTRVHQQNATAGELEAEKKAHAETKAKLEELKNSTDEAASGNLSRLEAEMLAHEATRNELLEEQASHNETKSALEDQSEQTKVAEEERDFVQGKLQDEKESHKDTKAVLDKEKDEHRGSKESLLKTQAALQDTEEDLRDTEEDLRDEQFSHNITKDNLHSSKDNYRQAAEEHDNSQRLFVGVMAGLAGLIIILAIVVFKLRRRSQVTEIDISVVAKDGKDHVVIGHPLPPDGVMHGGVHAGCAVVKPGELKKGEKGTEFDQETSSKLVSPAF